MAVTRGGSLTVMMNLQNALAQPLIYRFELVTNLISNVSTKEAKHLFPTLLESIFGCGADPGWGLAHICKNRSFYEFQYACSFLSPTGALMQLIYRLQADPYLTYEFPVMYLPAPAKRLIEEGVIPGLYANKLQLQPYGHPYLILSPFELFLFHFAYMLVNPHQSQAVPTWDNFPVCLYPTLVEDYLEYFLPLKKPRLPPVLHMHSTVRSPMLHPLNKIVPATGTSPPNSPKPVLGLGLLKPSIVIAQKQHLQGPSMVDQSEAETWRSLTLLEIFSEFWLNQNSLDTDRPGLVHHTKQNFIPTVNHIRVVRLLVKHLHYFVNSASPTIIASSFGRQTVASIDQFKRTTVMEIVQKKLYVFLRHAFEWWPLDSSFRLVLETWLSYIQPWRYVSSNTSTDSEANLTTDRCDSFVEDKWYTFVVNNLLFYSTIFHQMLPRLFRMDLVSPRNAYMLFRISKVFSHPKLCSMLQEAEKKIYSPGLRPSTTARALGGGSGCLPADHNVTAALNLQISEFERPGFNYKPLFDKYAADVMKQLLMCIEQAERQVDSVSTANYSSGYGLKYLWNEFISLFQLNGSSASNINMADLQLKVIQHLQQAQRNLESVFGVSTPPVFPAVDHNTTVLTQDSQVSSSSDDNSIPDCTHTSEGIQLTDLGRYQILNKLRKFDAKYQGDPDLQPIRSFENAFLVRKLYHLCSHINRHFSDSLEQLYHRQDLVGRMAKVYLMPPFKPDRQLMLSRVASTEKGPHLSLRFLANYQTILQLVLAYMVLRFYWGFGTPSYFFLLVVIVLFYGFLRAVFQVPECTTYLIEQQQQPDSHEDAPSDLSVRRRISVYRY